MGGSAPKSDPNIGIAALKSANTGEMMMNWMKDQAQITNGWASEDRARNQTVFKPMQDDFIAEAKAFASPARQQAAADAARADVSLGASQAAGQMKRQAMAMGVNPASGRFLNAQAKAGTDSALAGAGASNLARRSVEDQGRSLRASAINMGAGLAVNPGTSMGLSNNAGQAGFGGAMQGYQQQGSLLNADFQNRMSAWQANQGAIGSLGGALGTVAGLLFPSSEKIKENKRPVDALGAIEKMPVEQWDYKEGEGDGGSHVGPYAEDFQKATGIGDGKSIDALSMIGLTMGAVRELAHEVKEMKSNILKFAPMGAIAEEDDDEGDDEDGGMMQPMGAMPPPAKMRVAA